MKVRNPWATEFMVLPMPLEGPKENGPFCFFFVKFKKINKKMKTSFSAKGSIAGRQLGVAKKTRKLKVFSKLLKTNNVLPEEKFKRLKKS